MVWTSTGWQPHGSQVNYRASTVTVLRNRIILLQKLNFDVDTLIQDVADPDHFDADTQWQDTVDPCPAFCVKQLFLPKTIIVSVSLHLSLYQRFTLQMQLISKTVESFSVSP